jgi:hypothetical protein
MLKRRSLWRAIALVLLGLTTATSVISAGDCTPPARIGSLLRSLMEQPWWTYSWSDMSSHWPEPLSRLTACDPKGVPCWNYGYSPTEDARDCNHVFTFQPKRQARQKWGLQRVSLGQRASSLAEALRMTDEIEAELNLPEGYLNDPGGAWKARDEGKLAEFGEAARTRNQVMPRHYCWVIQHQRDFGVALSVYPVPGSEDWYVRVELRTSDFSLNRRQPPAIVDR